MTKPILVTGATGLVGRLVVDELHRAGAPVRALTRRPESANLPADVEVVSGDLTDPASLDAALQGAGTVFLSFSNRAARVRHVSRRGDRGITAANFLSVGGRQHLSIRGTLLASPFHKFLL
jgi:uncharacterized protein YbjT (DUF2867 family)